MMCCLPATAKAKGAACSKGHLFTNNLIQEVLNVSQIFTKVYFETEASGVTKQKEAPCTTNANRC